MEEKTIIHDIAVQLTAREQREGSIEDFVAAYLKLLPQVEDAYKNLKEKPIPAKVTTAKRLF